MEAEAVARQNQPMGLLQLQAWTRNSKQPEDIQFYGRCLETNLHIFGINREVWLFIQSQVMKENVLNLALGAAQ